MNKYRIKSKLNGSIIAEYFADAPMSHQSEWGKLEHIKLEADCSEEEKANALEVIEQEDFHGQIVRSYKFGPEYEVLVEDATVEINEKKKKQFSDLKVAQCEAQIKALLTSVIGVEMDYTTHLMVAQNAQVVAMNVLGDATQEEIDQAKGILTVYRNLFAQIQTLRTQRDAEIAAYDPSQE